MKTFANDISECYTLVNLYPVPAEYLQQKRADWNP